MENTKIKITAIKQYHVDEVKQLIVGICLEIWKGLLNEDDLKRYDSMTDINNVESHYFDNNGTFLVLLDEERIVGTGAIRKLDNQVCELKRMWLVKKFRGKGYGLQMVQMLFDFARQAGYEKVRLDLADEKHQYQALKFYKKLGFYPIERYNDSSCNVFMEMILS